MKLKYLLKSIIFIKIQSVAVLFVNLDMLTKKLVNVIDQSKVCNTGGSKLGTIAFTLYFLRLR